MQAISKTLLLSIFAIFSTQAMETAIQIKPSSLFSRTDVGEFELYHSNNGFTVVQDGEEFAVEQHAMDPVLRKMNTKQVEKFQNRGYIQVKKNDRNQFSLTSQVRARGGGAGGATAGFWIGRFAAQTVGYGIVAVAALPALAAGPFAYSVAVMGLAGTCAPMIESTSHAVAIGTAIILGTATGPA